MKLPKRLNEAINKKDKFLSDVRNKLEKTVLKLQISLYEQIIEDIIPKLDVKDGILIDNAKNYRLISELNTVYEQFNNDVIKTILPQIQKGINTITSLTIDFFTLSFTDLPKRFDEVLRKTQTLTDLKIGLRQGKMIRGGYLSNILTIDPGEFQNILSHAITSQMDMREFISLIKDNINGTDAKAGTLDRQFKRFAYDTFSQYDRTYNAKLADEFGMRYFSYDGNLIDDSRDFCAAHCNKVWSIEEAQEWYKWTVNKGIKNDEFPPRYDIKTKPERWNDVPSYIDYPGYDPITDLGGYNCRHIYAPIPDELAFKLRPDLKEK